MKGIALVFATLIGGIGTMVMTTTEPAHAVVYCQYIDYPVGCVARPGIVLRVRQASAYVAARSAIAAVPSTGWVAVSSNASQVRRSQRLAPERAPGVGLQRKNAQPAPTLPVDVLWTGG
jgi:hypothetical protein